jgi:YidC/Oxa1 family membrane protein insertase
LLAPSWGDQTILNLYGEVLTGILLDAGFQVTLRPHFQTRWNTPEVIDCVLDRFGDHANFTLVEQMSESDSLYSSHVMITDWSGAGIDYGLGLEKPVLYIDVQPKSRNKTYRELDIEPFESHIRDSIGTIVSPEKIATVPEAIRKLLEDPQQFREQVRSLRRESVFNVGRSAEVGAIAVARIADEVADAV